MERMDYDRDMVEQFRRNVVEKLVPVICKLKEEIKNKLGIDEFMFYDDAVSFVDGEPKPKLDKEGIFKAAQEAYDEMDEEIGKFMRSMQEDEAFDVDSRKGKWGGGYCTNFSDFKQTFILANFNGSSDDIDVVTHEFGHALAMNYAFDGDPELFIGGNETAECHSMSMEFLAWPFMDKFFDEPQNISLNTSCRLSVLFLTAALWTNSSISYTRIRNLRPRSEMKFILSSNISTDLI